MLAPRAVTPMQGDGDLTPILPESASRNFALEMLKSIEEQISASSITPVFQGQTGEKGAMTKYEVQQALMQSIRAIAGMVGAAAQWRKQEAEKKLRLGIRHIAKITGTRFDVPASQGLQGKSVEFGEVTSDKKKYAQTIRKMLEAQNIMKAKGQRSKQYFLDKERMKDYTFVVDFRVNPQARDSDAADEEEMKGKVALYRTGPTIDQSAVDKMLVRGLGDDEGEFIMKEKAMTPIPGMMPGQEQMTPDQQMTPQAQNPQASLNPETAAQVWTLRIYS